jgi:hypothetical protein
MSTAMLVFGVPQSASLWSATSTRSRSPEVEAMKVWPTATAGRNGAMS